jgi:hypothetical protein
VSVGFKEIQTQLVFYYLQEIEVTQSRKGRKGQEN